MYSFLGRSKQLLFSLLALTFILFGALLYIPQAQAQQAGVSIEPALIEPDESLDPGTTHTYSITIGNQNATEQIYYLFTRNIKGAQDSGAPIFADAEDEQTGYELADWITLETSEVTLGPGEEKTVNFTMNIPSTATPGSHFGGVFVTADPPEIERSGAAIGYQVANIISIRITGDANELASIRQFSTDKYFHGSADVNFSLRLENQGNVLIRPTGPLEITNMLGKEVATIPFNKVQGAVFPGSTREFKENWVGEGTGFGRYEATIALSYGNDGSYKTLSSTVTFWILPMNIILPALGALLVLLLVTYLFVRLYIKRTLARMGYSAGRSTRRRKRGPSTGLLLVVVMLCVTFLFSIILLMLFA